MESIEEKKHIKREVKYLDNTVMCFWEHSNKESSLNVLYMCSILPQENIDIYIFRNESAVEY